MSPKKRVNRRVDLDHVGQSLESYIDSLEIWVAELKGLYPDIDNFTVNSEIEYGEYGDRDRDRVYLEGRSLETDEEYACRLAKDEKEAEKQRAWKLQQFEELKKELGK